MLVYVLFCAVCPLPTIVTVWGMTSHVRNLAGPPTETYPSLTSQVQQSGNPMIYLKKRNMTKKKTVDFFHHHDRSLGASCETYGIER